MCVCVCESLSPSNEYAGYFATCYFVAAYVSRFRRVQKSRRSDTIKINLTDYKVISLEDLTAVELDPK